MLRTPALLIAGALGTLLGLYALTLGGLATLRAALGAPATDAAVSLLPGTAPNAVLAVLGYLGFRYGLYLIFRAATRGYQGP